jgi:hypothetical protein
MTTGERRSRYRIRQRDRSDYRARIWLVQDEEITLSVNDEEERTMPGKLR